MEFNGNFNPSAHSPASPERFSAKICVTTPSLRIFHNFPQQKRLVERKRPRTHLMNRRKRLYTATPTKSIFMGRN